MPDSTEMLLQSILNQSARTTERIEKLSTEIEVLKRDIQTLKDSEVPCPTCGKPGDFNEFRGSAVEKVMWEGYPGVYSKLKK